MNHNRLFSLAVPSGVDSSPEHFYKALHGLLRPARHRMLAGQPHISLELTGANNRTEFLLWVESGQEPFVRDLLTAAYSGVELTPVEDPLGNLEGEVVPAYVSLHKTAYLPIKRKFDEEEPLASLLQSLGRPGEGERIHIQLLVRPRAQGWQRGARRYARELKRGSERAWMDWVRSSRKRPQSVPHLAQRAKAVEEKAAELGFDCAVRVVASAKTRETAKEFLRAVIASLRPFAAENSFAIHDTRNNTRFLEAMRARTFPGWGTFILNTAEVAAFHHLPTNEPPSHVVRVKSPKLPPPKEIPSEGRVMGIANYPQQERPLALSVPDSRRHLHILGPTGVGKTTLLANLALQDIEAGRGVGVIDPKGDLVAGILERLPRGRMDDVILLSPDEADSVIGFNPFEWHSDVDRDLQGEDIRSVFEHIYSRFWGPKTDDILRACLSTLLSYPDSTLAHIRPLLTDKRFRVKMLEGLSDPMGVMGFWQSFEGMTSYQRNEAIAPLLNKLSGFTMRPKLRRVICKRSSSIDFEELVNGRKILLADLAVGSWGEGAAQLMGSFLFARIWQAIRKRSRIREEEREDFYLFVDEFQAFVASAARNFSDTLAQARSFRLALTLANQHLGQLPPELKEAIGANARSRIVFQCGQEDARYLTREFPGFSAEALQALPKYNVVAKLSAGGETLAPFTAVTEPPRGEADPSLAAEVAKRSRELYGRSIREIDAELEEILNPPSAGPDVPKRRAGRSVAE